MNWRVNWKQRHNSLFLNTTLMEPTSCYTVLCREGSRLNPWPVLSLPLWSGDTPAAMVPSGGVGDLGSLEGGHREPGSTRNHQVWTESCHHHHQGGAVTPV